MILLNICTLMNQFEPLIFPVSGPFCPDILGGKHALGKGPSKILVRFFPTLLARQVDSRIFQVVISICMGFG